MAKTEVIFSLSGMQASRFRT